MSELWPRAWSGHWPLAVAALVAALGVTANALASFVPPKREHPGAALGL